MRSFLQNDLSRLNDLHHGLPEKNHYCLVLRSLFTLIILLTAFNPTFAQEFGYNDFPATYNGVNITMSTNGSLYPAAYQGMCNVNGGTKANSIGLSSGNLYITFTFSLAVNNITIKIGAINDGHKSVYTTNAGTVSMSKFSGDTQCGANISGNVLTYSSIGGYADDRILISSTSSFTSLTVTQPADNQDYAMYTLYMGEVSPPQPGNPTSISASHSAICIGNSTQLTANGAQGTVYWYTGSCGGTQLTTGNPITVTPTVTTTYYARNYDNSQFSAGCASITITVKPLLQYRSVQSGNWTTLANWEQFNGESWVSATSYPGQISNDCSSPLVSIRASHLMEIQSGSTIDIPNLEIKATGRLTVKSGGKIFVQDQLKMDENASGAIVVE